MHEEDLERSSLPQNVFKKLSDVCELTNQRRPAVQKGGGALKRQELCFLSIKTRKHILVVTQNEMKVRIVFYLCCVLLDTTECGSSGRCMRSPRPGPNMTFFFKLINCTSSSLRVMLNFML